MGTGWRRAFCTSIPRDPPDTSVAATAPESPVLKSCSRVRLGFFSSSGGGDGGSCPATPRAATAAQMQQQQQQEPDAAVPALRCRTKCTPPVTPQEGSKPSTPASSNPSSPRSPSRFALLRLRLSRTTCGVCVQGVKTGQGRAIFTAECSHAFHFPCIAAHVRKQGALVCPVCNAKWRQVPLLSDHLLINTDQRTKLGDQPPRGGSAVAPAPTELKPDTRGGGWGIKTRSNVTSAPESPHRIVAKHKYDDDEPLLSPGGTARFNPIAEGDESADANDENEFRGFFSANTPRSDQSCGGAAAFGGLQLALAPDVLLLSPGRTHDKYVIALKIKAPPAPLPSPTSAATGLPLLDSPRRAPVDLVTVLDVGGSMTGAKLNMLKRAIRLVVSSLGPADRLAIIGSAAAAKRLMPLRRMTPQAQRAARRIVDGLVCGEGCCVGDALRKATRVLEDRRERNPVASIMLLSDGQQQPPQSQPQQQQQRYPPPMPEKEAAQQHQRYRRLSSFPQHRAASAAGTRFAHVEIPVQQGGHWTPAPAAAEDAFAKCVGGLLSVVVQDVRLHLTFPPGEITAVYSASGQPAVLGVGGGSIRLGDLYADEERELLVEIRVPINLKNHHAAVLNARCAYRDPATQELVASAGEKPMAVPLPPSLPPPSSAAANPRTVRLHNLYVATRAIVEARRLADLADFGTALHLLLSARAVLLQSPCAAAEGENLAFLEAELADMQRRREDKRKAGPREPLTPAAAWRMGGDSFQGMADVDGGEPLTPTSAWRAAEKLAKVAIMRKSINRVSDLHGFENARF